VGRFLRHSVYMRLQFVNDITSRHAAEVYTV